MSSNDPILCTRCGRNRTFSEAQWQRIAEKGGPPKPPPLPPGVCLECGWKDPNLREPIRAWMNEMGAWSEQRLQQFLARLREFVARPLEAIDRFVDSLR